MSKPSEDYRKHLRRLVDAFGAMSRLLIAVERDSPSIFNLLNSITIDYFKIMKEKNERNDIKDIAKVLGVLCITLEASLDALDEREAGKNQ